MPTPSTAFASITAAVGAALQAAHPGVSVSVNRTRPVSAGSSSALRVYLLNSKRDPSGPLDGTYWLTTILVDCMARAPAGSDPAQAVDGLLTTAWAALIGAPLSIPGVFDIDSVPAIEWEFDSADTQSACATIRLLVRHSTQLSTLTP